MPDTDDYPSLAAELARDALVASHVAPALFIPELPVGFRAGVALRAAVPETSVYEDGDLLLGKGKVGLSGQGKMPSPAGDLVLLQQAQQRLLGLLVSFTANERHYLGTLLFSENVSQFLNLHRFDSFVKHREVLRRHAKLTAFLGLRLR